MNPPLPLPGGELYELASKLKRSPPGRGRGGLALLWMSVRFSITIMKTLRPLVAPPAGRDEAGKVCDEVYDKVCDEVYF